MDCKKCVNYHREGKKNCCYAFPNNIVLGELAFNQLIKDDCGMYHQKTKGLSVQELCNELTNLCHSGKAQKELFINSSYVVVGVNDNHGCVELVIKKEGI